MALDVQLWELCLADDLMEVFRNTLARTGQEDGTIILRNIGCPDMMSAIWTADGRAPCAALILRFDKAIFAELAAEQLADRWFALQKPTILQWQDS